MQHSITALGTALACVLLGLGCSSGSGTDAGRAPTTTRTEEPADDCAGDSEALPRDGAATITVDGHERQYLVSAPAEPGDGPLPLIVNLHGHGGSAAQHEANTELGAEGSARGFVVVTPGGLGDPARWNFDRQPDGADDYRFIDELVADLVGRYCIDAERIHVVGSSNGAAFAGLLACTAPYRFTAVAMVIATMPSTCIDSIAPARLTIRGTADVTVPYGDTPGIIATDAEHHGCDLPAEVDHPMPGVDRTRYSGCHDDAEIVLDTVVGGVHAWPGSANAVRSDNSRAGVEFPATDEVLDFFARVGGSS